MGWSFSSYVSVVLFGCGGDGEDVGCRVGWIWVCVGGLVCGGGKDVETGGCRGRAGGSWCVCRGNDVGREGSCWGQESVWLVCGYLVYGIEY